jgi:hypothetical protein
MISKTNSSAKNPQIRQNREKLINLNMELNTNSQMEKGIKII